MTMKGKGLKPLKGIKPLKQAHTSNSQVGTGDYYGQGIRAKVGKLRESYMDPPTSNKSMGKPPKKLG
jgi:hypothetical protein